MTDVSLSFRRQQKYVMYVLAAYVLGYGILPYQALFLGLIIGTAFSYFNLWLLMRRMQAFDKAVAKGKMIRSLGTASRFCNAIIAVAIAFKYNEDVHMAGVIVGLMTIYPVIMIDSIIQLKRSSMEER
ncbi:ATP synthase subunit I [Bacillus sp. CLL-7-23]|uniref:ATP synthase subunit I n=1 Tax=Bacillus changyiensis TaxID=3004103 RepID=A0ABT4WZN3_9BACI|nr:MULTISPECIES: ATP synthase subunit I [Bacillus]MDA7025390.1 ATP synthase subunit I [Bacillus changyiensis]NPC94450.1 ATP synthase subunit I [Bacillus sp. WMMC1349]